MSRQSSSEKASVAEWQNAVSSHDEILLDRSSVSSNLTPLSIPSVSPSPNTDPHSDLANELASSVETGVVIKQEDAPERRLSGFKRISSPETSKEAASPIKRRPGRPPKERPEGSASRKPRVNERSKTGCMTCRKRKKKCDETKPVCLNCSKTNYRCEGYPERRIWEPKKSLSVASPTSSSSGKPNFDLPQQLLSPIFPGVENEIDRLFLDHFIDETSRVLTVQTSDGNNPWKDVVIPMARESKRLMHAILALGGSHLIRSYKPEESDDYEERQKWHLTAAARELHEGVESQDEDRRYYLASLMVQTLLAVNQGFTNGEHRILLDSIALNMDHSDTPFSKFLIQLYKYCETSQWLTSMRSSEGRSGISPAAAFLKSTPATSPTSEYPPSTVQSIGGVIDERLLSIVARVTRLRNEIRACTPAGRSPAVGADAMKKAVAIDCDLREWDPQLERGTAAHVLAELHRAAFHAALARSTREPQANGEFAEHVRNGLRCLALLPADDAGLSMALLPAFLLGCAAFAPAQRGELGGALDAIEAYNRNANVELVRGVLRKVWERMDAGDPGNWDWEDTVKSMGISFLIV